MKNKQFLYLSFSDARTTTLLLLNTFLFVTDEIVDLVNENVNNKLINSYPT